MNTVYSSFGITTTTTTTDQPDEAKAHAARVASEVAEAIHAKYCKGQQEHGGQIWKKAGMLGHAEDEARDLSVYHHVLRDQLAALRAHLADTLAELDAILGTPED